MKDLVILASDKNMEFALKGLLSRYPALGIREVLSDLFVHPHHDPGCLLEGHDFLRLYISSHRHGLVMLDREGSGQEELSRESLEQRIEGLLAQSGWEDRASAIVIDPELEVWVWSDSPHVDTVLGREGKQPDLRAWLLREGLLLADQTKPTWPKEAVERALRLVSRARSSSHYLELGRKVSIERCADPAFAKLKQTLRMWFPQRQ
ncbi:MAG: hypothetical protein HY316_06655 [Acidobacteria bacterium]|nr:hypothetical protein [Acidobacteriota bacterium]